VGAGEVALGCLVVGAGGIRTFCSTGTSCGLSAACPAVRTNDSGRHVRSAARTLARQPPVWPPPFCRALLPLDGGLFEGTHDLLADTRLGGVVAGAGGVESTLTRDKFACP
jgi:hypothetical protein